MGGWRITRTATGDISNGGPTALTVIFHQRLLVVHLHNLTGLFSLLGAVRRFSHRWWSDIVMAFLLSRLSILTDLRLRPLEKRGLKASKGV